VTVAAAVGRMQKSVCSGKENLTLSLWPVSVLNEENGKQMAISARQWQSAAGRKQLAVSSKNGIQENSLPKA